MLHSDTHAIYHRPVDRDRLPALLASILGGVPPWNWSGRAASSLLARTQDLPLSRFSRVELHRLVVERGVTDASASTIWRWLHEDAIKPWQTRSWIFPRDPDFAEKGRPGAGSLRADLRGQAAAPRRVRRQRR